MFSDTFAGITPAFIAAQLIGGTLAVALIRTIYPGVTAATAADVTVPRTTGRSAGSVPASGEEGRADHGRQA